MNIAGFFRTTKLTFVSKQHESGDIYSFHFTSAKPIKHLAGQHGLFFLPKFKGMHIFSLSSSPEEKYISFATHVRQGSQYKQYLQDIQPGAQILMRGPVLDFTLQRNQSEYVFLAQGIGITPFRSILLHARQLKLKINSTLIHVDGSDHTFRTETQSTATNAYYPTNPSEFTSLVINTLSDTNKLYYLSGSPKFIYATKDLLRQHGIAKSNIKSDNFIGY